MPEKKGEPKPYKGICCSRCYSAKSEKKKCKCRCHGTHHGEAYKTKDNDKTEGKTITPSFFYVVKGEII